MIVAHLLCIVVGLVLGLFINRYLVGKTQKLPEDDFVFETGKGELIELFSTRTITKRAKAVFQRGIDEGSLTQEDFEAMMKIQHTIMQDEIFMHTRSLFDITTNEGEDTEIIVKLEVIRKEQNNGTTD